MENKKLLKTLAAVCAAVLLIAAAVKWLPTAFAEQYHVGDGEISATIKELKINWTSGVVHIAYDSLAVKIAVQEKEITQIAARYFAVILI